MDYVAFIRRMRPQAYSTWIFRERSGEARKNTTVKVPHYARKLPRLPRHMANNFTTSLYANGIPIMYVASFARDRQYFYNTGSPHSFIKIWWPRITLQNTNCPLGLPNHAASTLSWLATLNSAAHAHLAIGAYLAYRRIDPYR